MTFMKTKFALALLAPISVVAAAHGQGTLRITFDGPPIVPPGGIYNTQQYYEAGMVFLPTPAAGSFQRVGVPTDPAQPNDGTAYVRAVFGQGLLFSFLDGSVFTAISVDLAGLTTTTSGSAYCVGHHPDGSTVTADLFEYGGFRTLSFGAGFTNLKWVDITSSMWSLDNLVISVPEPGPAGLVLLGGLALGASRRAGGRRQS